MGTEGTDLKPSDEADRLRALRRYDILDTRPEEAFDRVAALAAQFFDLSVAMVSFVDRDRIWFKATHGVDLTETERARGLCASAILQDAPSVITDAAADPRCFENPLVHGELGVRFYAGAPIRTGDGHNVGTVHVVSDEPRGVTATELRTLADLAGIIADELEARLRARQTVADLEAAQAGLSTRLAHQEAVAELASFALQVDDLDDLFERTLSTVGKVLDVPLLTVLEREDDDASFVMRAGIGWRDGTVGAARVPKDSRAGYAVTYGAPVLVTDAHTEHRFQFSPLLAEHGVRCGMSAPIRATRQTYGVLGVHATDPRAFSEDDVLLVAAVADILGSAVGRVEAEEELREQALRDPLTSLPNRTLLFDRTEKALARLERNDKAVAALFVDLDNFKDVNDSLGHEAGDDVLGQIAQRLEQAVRPGDTVARFGGDEFVVLCTDLDSVDAASCIAERIVETMAEPYVLGDRLLQVTASLGVAAGAAGVRASELLRAADNAMYRAKERGPARIEMYNDELREGADHRLAVQLDLRDALERDELRLVYQPQVATDGWRITGAEALLRWQHPTRALLTPADFLSVAEQTGLIVPIGAWVRAEAVSQLAAWDRDGIDLAHLAVNLSSQDLADPRLADELTELLAAHQIDARRLCVEVTETAILHDLDAASDTLAALSRLGVSIALDDFGTGYSSLRHLHELPVDVVKIDRTFIAHLDEQPPRSALAEGTLAMLHTMGIDAVAEGVETRSQLRALERLECATIQGFLFSRPVAPAEIAGLLAAGVVPRDVPPVE